MKTIYIPWFWNYEDKIFQNYLSWEWDIIQKNLKNISSENLSYFLKWKSNNEVFSILKWHYPNLDKEVLEKVVNESNDFKWFTRKISITTSLTIKKILDIIDWWEKYKIVWHSQWWLITIKAILDNPDLLNNLKEIHLLAPVVDLDIWWNFHYWKEFWYLNWKWIIVRPEYIWELKWDTNMLYELLGLLKKLWWDWILKLILWKNDKVIPITNFDIEKIKMLYPKILLEIVEWDHYLWFK